MLNVKKDFPILKRRINGRRLVYLDSAATSQKPKQVIKAEMDFYENYNSNVRRALHKLSEEATELYEESRKTVARFVNASPDEIVFTKGATEAINIVANSGIVERGDEVIVTLLEHHSNMVPWLALRQKGVFVKFAEINDDGTLDYDSLIRMVNINTKLIAVAHVSNSLGTINDIEYLANELRKRNLNPHILVDAAQSIGHLPVDVNKLKCDFLVFSGHKMFGPMGIGVLCARRDLLEKMEPLIRGGDMIKTVTLEGATWADGPVKFEGGTQNVAGAVGLAEAVRYIEKVGIDKIQKHDREMMDYALEQLSKIDGITIHGPTNSLKRSGSVSFSVDGVHPHDVSQILSDNGVAIRSGHLCTQPLMKRLGVDAVCRTSFHIYNDKKDIDALVKGLEKVKKVFK